MSTHATPLSDALYQYLLNISLREPDVLRRLRAETASHPESKMQIAPDQGQFMSTLVRMTGARKTLEVGVFTGYSSLVVALSLPPDGTIIACDVSEEYTAIARKYWREAGVAEKIDLRVAPAGATLDHLLHHGHASSFDFVFIDADKEGYDGYYEQSLQLVRPGGLIVIDNVFRGGEVIDPAVTNSGTESIRALNAKILTDDRVHISMIAVGDGLTLAVKK